MTPDEIRQLVQNEIRRFIDRSVFDKNIQILDARNIQLGKGTGTKIGTETTQKLSVFNATPVIQALKITDPTTGPGELGYDQTCRNTVYAIIDALENFGITSKT